MTKVAGMVELESSTQKPKRRRAGVWWVVLVVLTLVGVTAYGFLQPIVLPTCTQSARHVIAIFNEGREPLVLDNHYATQGELRQRCVRDWDLESRQDIAAADTAEEMREALRRSGMSVTRQEPRDPPKVCVAEHRAGLCLPKSECTGVSTPGLCEGDANVQCCTLYMP